MSRLILFYRLIVRPLFREPVRAALTLLAIALGVAVVLAIDLAGTAAAGSFRSSMETLAGQNDLEVVTAGGVPEKLLGVLAALPYALRITPRIEDYAVLTDTKQTLPLLGLDLVAEASRGNASLGVASSDDAWRYLTASDSIWVGESLGWKNGDRLQLLVNDQVSSYTVRGIFPDSNGNASAIVMDIAAAQRALKRFGVVDRVLLTTPPDGHFEEW
jgi:putative ABC transport system permease protein